MAEPRSCQTLIDRRRDPTRTASVSLRWSLWLQSAPESAHSAGVPFPWDFHRQSPNVTLGITPDAGELRCRQKTAHHQRGHVALQNRVAGAVCGGTAARPESHVSHFLNIRE